MSQTLSITSDDASSMTKRTSFVEKLRPVLYSVSSSITILNCFIRFYSIRLAPMHRRKKSKTTLVPRHDATPTESFSVGDHLYNHGVVVRALIPESERNESLKDGFLRAVMTFPEYLPGRLAPPFDHVPSLGGFGALNNIASFHNEFVRNLRKHIYEQARRDVYKPFLDTFNQILPNDKANPYSDVVSEEPWRSQLLFDRMMWRRASAKASPESWHRDVATKEHPKGSPTGLAVGDFILGGWTNLTDQPQSFNCIPGSHFNDLTNGEHTMPAQTLYNCESGFKPPSKEEILNLNLEGQKKQVYVPPYHSIFFFQQLLHEVVAKASDHDQFRLFHGHRLTQSMDALFARQYEQRKLFEHQASPLLPSGQECHVFGGNHASLLMGLPNAEVTDDFRLKFFEWPSQKKKSTDAKTCTPLWCEQTFKRACLEQKMKGDFEYALVSRPMKSLVDSNRVDSTILPYRQYNDEERNLYETCQTLN